MAYSDKNRFDAAKSEKLFYNLGFLFGAMSGILAGIAIAFIVLV